VAKSRQKPAFRVVKERGRLLTRRPGRSRAATEEEAWLWNDRRALLDRLEELEEELAGREAADAIAETAREGRALCYKALATRAKLVKQATKCADSLRVLSSEVSDLMKEGKRAKLSTFRLTQARSKRDVARDVAAATTREANNHIAACREVWRVLRTGRDPDEA